MNVKNKIVPDILKAEEVIEWFIFQDEKIKDFREWWAPHEVNDFKAILLKDVNELDSAEKIQNVLNIFGKQHPELLMKIASAYEYRKNLARSLNEEEQKIYTNLIRAESFLAAKLRILGYFLLKKYGIDPRS